MDRYQCYGNNIIFYPIHNSGSSINYLIHNTCERMNSNNKDIHLGILNEAANELKDIQLGSSEY